MYYLPAVAILGVCYQISKRANVLLVVLLEVRKLEEGSRNTLEHLRKEAVPRLERL